MTEECAMLGDGESRVYNDTESAIHEYFGEPVKLNERDVPTMTDKEAKECANED